MGNKISNPRTLLKELRESKGTQRFIAQELGITETHLRELESGRSVPGTRLLKRIEHYFGVPDELIFPDLHEPDFFMRS